MRVFDAIVIGLGAMGSAAVCHLAQDGKKVLGLEAFTTAHDKGSSHGVSRVIRQTYFESPLYVPLLVRAYELWDRLQRDTNSDLLRITGGLMIGDPAGVVVAGTIRSALEHSLPHRILDAKEVMREFRQFHLSADEIAVLEPRAGCLCPEECIRKHLEQASRFRAELHFEEPMTSWTASSSGDGVTVRTAAGQHHAKRLVLTTGAWAPEILKNLGLPLRVVRKVMFWFEPIEEIDAFESAKCPIYMWEPRGRALFYGFPALEGKGKGVKVAIHRVAADAQDVECNPDLMDRAVHPEDEEAMRAEIRHRIPGLNGKLLRASVCMYTMTPDEHFIIDRHPVHPQVILGAGFSGHGFKFSSVVGEILADLASKGSTSHDLSLFGVRRFSIAE